MDYLCVQNVSEKWGISKRRIQILCREGRIAGAKRVGNMWVIPENTEKPLDARKKTPVKTEGKQTSFLRRDLKKLLKELYQDCEKKQYRWKTEEPVYCLIWLWVCAKSILMKKQIQRNCFIKFM